MQFTIRKDDLFNGVKVVERATATKGLQPVLANILIETVDKSTVRMTATDLDLTVIVNVEAQVTTEGTITLPARKLSEIVSRVTDSIILFTLEPETNNVEIKGKKYKTTVIGLDAREFPTITNNEPTDALTIELKPFINSIKKAGFAAASYESNNLLSGVVCDISESTLEMASTDGNRLARVRTAIDNKDGKTAQLIIPGKALSEFQKIAPFISDNNISIYTDKTKLIIKSATVTLITRLMEGQYPKYNQLIPADTAKAITINIAEFVASIERVSVMVNDKTSIVKFAFSNVGILTLAADTPDTGASSDELDIEYTDEAMIIAFNYRYVLDALKNMDAESVVIGMNTATSATLFKPSNDDDYTCLIMPVQVR